MVFLNCYLMWHSLGQGKALASAQDPCSTTECSRYSLAPGFPFPSFHQLQDPEPVRQLGTGNPTLASPLPTGPLPQSTATAKSWAAGKSTANSVPRYHRYPDVGWVRGFPSKSPMERTGTRWPLLCSTWRHLRMCLSNLNPPHSPSRPHLVPRVEGNRQRSQGGPGRQEHACPEAPDSY